MNIKTLKILIIPFLLAVMLGGTYLMPRRGEVQDSSISMDLPTGMNPYGWHGTRRQESEQERGILAPATEFSKADYVQELPISLDATETVPVLCRVSIVKSGHDLNNSIHRPERCLPAQGHFNLTGTTVDVPVEGRGTIRMTKLKSQQNIAPDHPQPVILDSMYYYRPPPHDGRPLDPHPDGYERQGSARHGSTLVLFPDFHHVRGQDQSAGRESQGTDGTPYQPTSFPTGEVG